MLNLGDVWLPNSPTVSLYQERLLLQLVDPLGYHLIQKLYWENPSKMPGPAEYVTIRRIRVTPSIENVWWLSPTPNPKANNRNVLVDYSSSMRNALTRGTNAGMRPCLAKPSAPIMAAPSPTVCWSPLTPRPIRRT
jgi:hypothetical protein